MTTISTEDFYSGMRMNYKGAKTLGMAIVIVAFLAGAFNSILITNPSILDTDPSTYVIVVMLMSFVFLVFGMKERLEISRDRRDLAYAALIFAAYFLALSLSRVGLSYLFITYRIDALLFPLLLASIVTAVFGIDGLKRLRYPIVYTVFASPLLLIPVLGLNQGFALLNAKLIYGALSALGIGVVEKGLLLTAPSTTSISISTTCVSLGFFAAMVMFLAPVAYLYNGRNSRRCLFVAAGVVLLLVLNVLRMLVLSMVWVYYGLGSAIGAFHLFAGQLLFYASIVIMLLLAGKLGLSLGEKGKVKATKAKATLNVGNYLPGIALAMLIGAIALVLSLSYTHSVSSPLQFANATQAPESLLYSQVFASLNASGQAVTLVGSNLNGTVFVLGPRQANLTLNNTYVLASVSTTPMPGRIIGAYNSVLESNARLLRNGITVKSSVLTGGNLTLRVSYYALPYNVSGSQAFVNYEFISLANTAMQQCGAGDSGAVEQLQTAVYNIFSGGFGHDIMNCQAELVAAAARG